MNMTATASERLLIVVYGTTDPTDDDFSKFLEAVNRNRFGILGTRILLLVPASPATAYAGSAR